MTCAVTPELHRDVALVSLADYKALRACSQELRPEVEYLTGTPYLFEDPESLGDKNARLRETRLVHKHDKLAERLGETRAVQLKSAPLSPDLERSKLYSEYKDLQLSDPTLKSCWDLAAGGGEEFVVNSHNSLLYRLKVIGGFKVDQLVLPEVKRKEVIQCAHDSEWSMHFGVTKTLQRIESHFYWPTMNADVQTYVKSCFQCQRHSRKSKLDRVPIEPVARSRVSFDQVNIDLIGPLSPKSSSGHEYVLCLVDSCTRWAEAEPLKSLTAKALCDALLLIFTRIGIPRVVISDQATNMVAGLTKEMYKRLGVELRNSTPLHPQANGLVERFNQTLKNMIHHVVNSDRPREWHLRLPYLLWAYRELPNSTTGLSPYQLVYGRLGRGPLAVLKSTWSDDVQQSSLLPKTVAQYMTELRERLDVGLDLADEVSKEQQDKYVSQHNKLARDKKFVVGDLVWILLPSSTNKLVSSWQGPATVVAVVSTHSYRVALDNGAVRTLHANDLRKYISRVNSVGVVFQDDEDFGHIEPCPVDPTDFEVELGKVDLSHLPVDEKRDMMDLLIKYKDVFSMKPGHCKVACHQINLVDGFQPKAHYPYRIPEKLREEVDRQILQLLQDNKIRPSTSAYAHPLVCVVKPDSSIRLCTDLRYINSGTVNDAYPIPQCEDLLLQISSSSYITSLDCTSGFWQLPMKESDAHKTAFVTHRGLFEWLVMPFGVKTASGSFQRVMDNLLRPHSDYSCAYIDDVAVHSKTWSDHLQHLESVLQAFLQVGMTLRLSKCQFGKSKIKFIGHYIGSGCRSVDQSKVDAIQKIPEPHTKKLLRSFLGMCNFFRVYVPNYSRVVLPLTELTKNIGHKVIKFNDVQRHAFQTLKQKLCEATVLYAPKSSKPFIIRSDSSDYAVGASLSQVDDSGLERPIAFASAKLSDVQRRWSTIEREAYGILFALKKFEYIIFGRKIELYTDHNPLQYLTASAPNSPKLTRWLLSLARFDITVRHIKGRDNVIADCLSRNIESGEVERCESDGVIKLSQGLSSVNTVEIEWCDNILDDDLRLLGCVVEDDARQFSSVRQMWSLRQDYQRSLRSILL